MRLTHRTGASDADETGIDMGIKRVHRALASVAATALIAGVTVVGTTGGVEAGRPNANVKENPDLAAACGTDVIIVLDEATSVGPYVADVSTATQALVNEQTQESGE